MDESIKPSHTSRLRLSPRLGTSRLMKRVSAETSALVRTVSSTEELRSLLWGRAVWHPDNPLPERIVVPVPIVIPAIDVSFISPDDLWSSQGRPIILTDARNIDFGPATLTGDWRHSTLAGSDLSRARLAGIFHSSSLDGALINHLQHFEFMRRWKLPDNA